MSPIRPSLKPRGRGQSLVEFTISLPVLLMMLSGLIEFGFLLNDYLDLIDAAREAARFAANDDPTLSDPPHPSESPNFWNRAWRVARDSLITASDGRIDWKSDPFNCDAVEGDIVVSAFSVKGTTVVAQFPPTYADVGAANCAIWGGNPLIWGTPLNPKYPSKLTKADVNALLSGASIPNSGFVVVEIYYEYDVISWFSAFLPDPIVLYAYTIMPNTYAEPPTP